MDFLPAIDLRAGCVVRLAQGDYHRETVYGSDAVVVARSFAEAGARWIHVVDLDAARTGEPVNRAVVGAVCAAVGRMGVQVQSGGGVRSVPAAESLFAAGVARVVIGTAAVEDPELVAAVALVAPPAGVAVGLDARREGERYEVAVRGWTIGSGNELFSTLDALGSAGAHAVVITEIGRDGMLSGPDLHGLAQALAATRLDLIASGGVSSLEDLMALAALDVDGRRLAGAITGRALYEGRFDVRQGVAACVS